MKNRQSFLNRKKLAKVTAALITCSILFGCASKKSEGPSPEEVYNSQVVEATYDGLEKDMGKITGSLKIILPDKQNGHCYIATATVTDEKIFEKYVSSHLKEGQKLYLVKSAWKEANKWGLFRSVWLKKPIVTQDKEGSIVVTADNQNNDNSENTLDEMLFKNGIVETGMHTGEYLHKLRDEAYENRRGIFQNRRN